MTPITLFKRYVWLIDTIHSTGTISKEEIDRRWSLSSLNDKHESRIPRCTFFRQKGAIQDLFGVTNFRAKYLCSLPLHHTQKVVRTNEQFTWLELHVAPTFDFIQEIRSLGNEVCIESPDYLRDELLFDYRTSQEQYNE